LTVLFKFTVVAEIVRSLFEINYHFESKQDRTIYLFEMIENMTVISNLQKKENTHPLKKDGLYSFPNASIFIISKGKSIIISKRQSIIISKRQSIHYLGMKVNPSSRNESRSIISKRESIVISK